MSTFSKEAQGNDSDTSERDYLPEPATAVQQQQQQQQQQSTSYASPGSTLSQGSFNMPYFSKKTGNNRMSMLSNYSGIVQDADIDTIKYVNNDHNAELKTVGNSETTGDDNTMAESTATTGTVKKSSVTRSFRNWITGATSTSTNTSADNRQSSVDSLAEPQSLPTTAGGLRSVSGNRTLPSKSNPPDKESTTNIDLSIPARSPRRQPVVNGPPTSPLPSPSGSPTKMTFSSLHQPVNAADIQQQQYTPPSSPFARSKRISTSSSKRLSSSSSTSSLRTQEINGQLDDIMQQMEDLQTEMSGTPQKDVSRDSVDKRSSGSSSSNTPGLTSHESAKSGSQPLAAASTAQSIQTSSASYHTAASEEMDLDSWEDEDEEDEEENAEADDTVQGEENGLSKSRASTIKMLYSSGEKPLPPQPDASRNQSSGTLLSGNYAASSTYSETSPHREIRGSTATMLAGTPNIPSTAEQPFEEEQQEQQQQQQQDDRRAISGATTLTPATASHNAPDLTTAGGAAGVAAARSGSNSRTLDPHSRNASQTRCATFQPTAYATTPYNRSSGSSTDLPAGTTFTGGRRASASQRGKRHSKASSSGYSSGTGGGNKMKPFSYNTLARLLNATDGIVIGQEFASLEMPKEERYLLEKIVGSISKLTANMMVNPTRYDQSCARLERVLNVLEGFD